MLFIVNRVFFNFHCHLFTDNIDKNGLSVLIYHVSILIIQLFKVLFIGIDFNKNLGSLDIQCYKKKIKFSNVYTDFNFLSSPYQSNGGSRNSNLFFILIKMRVL